MALKCARSWTARAPARSRGLSYYGLLGLQLYSLQSNLWSHMCRAYEVIRAALLEVEDEPGVVS